MEAQEYQTKSEILWQDNEASKKMAKNGKMSFSSKSRHIGIKLFWVYDRVKQGNISVKHFPTNKMLAYFFTKPPQISELNMFRRVIMGWDDIATL